MPDSLTVLGFTPAIKIIGRTIGKIFNRLYTVFTEGDEHSRRYTGHNASHQPAFGISVRRPRIALK